MLVSTSVQKRKAGAMAETKRYDELETVQIPEQEVRPEGSDTSTLPEEREEGITKPFDTKSIRIESKSGNMNTLLDRLQNDEIDLQPDFQRQAGIWNEENQSRLMESFMLRIPVPAFYFDGTNDEKWLVVDGLQRLTAVQRFVIKQDLRLCGLEYLRSTMARHFPSCHVHCSAQSVKQTLFGTLLCREPQKT